MALPENLKKGDPLVLVSAGRNEKAENVSVARIGSKYVYVTVPGTEYENPDKFHRTTGASVVNIGWARTLVTPEQYSEMKERERLLAGLKEAGIEIRHNLRDVLPVGQLRVLLDVMQHEITDLSGDCCLDLSVCEHASKEG